MSSSNTGNLIVLSGPSGVGKSTVVSKLLETCPLPLEISISATTREPRPGETDGEDYRFLSEAEFQRLKQEDEFLEYAEVFGIGEWYGTLRQPVTECLKNGKNVILEIDVTGALMVLSRYPDAVTIFIHPGTLEELEKRLRGRGTEDEERIKRRLAVAQAELEMAPQYTHVIQNEDIQTTADKICGLLSKLGEQKSCTTN